MLKSQFQKNIRMIWLSLTFKQDIMGIMSENKVFLKVKLFLVDLKSATALKPYTTQYSRTGEYTGVDSAAVGCTVVGICKISSQNHKYHIIPKSKYVYDLTK